MHKKAQYVDGKLIDDKGQFVDNKPKLNPPPPITVEEIKPKRKNISITRETWKAWKDIKGTKKWDTILSDALELFKRVKDLEGIITQIALQKPTIIQGGNYVGNNTGITRIPNAKRVPTSLSRQKKLPFLEEIKDLVDKLDKQNKDIRSILTPLDDINQEEIQVSEEVLEKRMKETEERSRKLWKKKKVKGDVSIIGIGGG